LLPVQEINPFPDGMVAALSFGSSPEELSIYNVDGSSQTWDLLDVELTSETAPLEGAGGNVIAVSQSGDLLALLRADGSIDVVDRLSGTSLSQPMLHDAFFVGPVTDIVFSPDGSIVATAGNDGAIVLWDSESQSPIGPPLLGHSSVVFSLAFHPDGTFLASRGCRQFHPAGGCLTGEVFIWDVEKRQVIAETDSLGFSPAVAFSPDGNIIAYGDCDRIEVAAACLEGAVQQWDFQNNEVLDRYTGHTSLIWSLEFNPDGSILASSSGDNTITLWDTTTGQPAGQRLTNHGGAVRRLTFSPDGSKLASAGFDNSVFLWDVDSGQAYGGPFAAHTGFVMDVRFSPDGRTLASSSIDGSIIYWDVELDSWTDKACGIANRNLRTEEWEQFLGQREYNETCDS
jgi:WD40 repeat protein